MDRVKILMAIFIAVLLLLGGNIALTVRDSAKVSHQVNIVCREHQALAQIKKEENAEEALNSHLHFSIPGLTQKELAELTLKKAERERHALELLEEIRMVTC